MATIQVKVTGAKEASRMFHELRSKRLPDMVRQLQWLIGERVSLEANAQVRKHFRRRTGNLMRHVANQRHHWEGPDVVWGLPAGELQTRIAAFLNQGGRIRPVKAKMLRIPLPAAMTAAGVDRFAGRSLREVKGFFVHNDKLWRIDPRGKRIQPWYLLKPYVDIKRHPWFDDTVKESTRKGQQIANRLVKALDAQITNDLRVPA